MTPTSRTFLAQAMLLVLFPATLALASAPAAAQSSDASTDASTSSAQESAAKPDKDGSTKNSRTNDSGIQDSNSQNSSSMDSSSMDSSSKTSSKSDNTTNATADLGSVDKTLRAQVLLERAHFSPGVIDGVMGGNTRRALSAYQSANGLSVTAEADDKTIDSLGGADAPVLTRQSLTADDVAGPFRDTPDGAEAMSKVDSLPYESVEEKVAEQFHVTPGWLHERNPDVKLVAGATLTVPKLDGASDLPKPARVIVDESDKSLLLEDDSGKVIAHFPVTTGSAQFPLPIGEWKVTGVAEDPVWHFNPKLIAGTSADAKSADIPPGPNNPVGVVWIDLSKEHYGIHGTPDPTRIGKTASNGCIRMTNWSATALSKVVNPGMPVTMRH